MVRVGIIGLGMMGRTHYEAYETLPDVSVVAVCDIDPKRAGGDLSGTGGNVLAGGLTRLPMDRIRGVRDYQDLINASDIDLIDICVPTPTHAEIAIAALGAGKHVISEKPLARTVEQGRTIVEAAGAANGVFMPAMCMRFWPQWVWLKQCVQDLRFGAVRAAHFRRVASMPGGWYHDGQQSGGAVMDLHIHDVDFIHHLFGKPRAVFSTGYTKTSGQLDHIHTQYLYDDVPLVTAEGGWCMADGFGFRMQYTINFERATASFDIGAPEPLVVFADGKKQTIVCDGDTGYVGELRYITDCIRKGEKPSIVTAEDALQVLQTVDAEIASVQQRRMVDC